MSILQSCPPAQLALTNLFAAGATSSVTTQSANPAIAPLDWLFIVGSIAGLVIAFRLGAFRRGSIRTPGRPTVAGSALPLLGVALVGFLASNLFAALFIFRALPPVATTQPTTDAATRAAPSTAAATATDDDDDPLSRLPPTQGAIVELGEAAAGLAAMILLTLLLHRDGMERLGLDLARVPRGLLIGAIGAVVAIPWTVIASGISAKCFELANHPPQDHPLLVELEAAKDPQLRLVLILTAVLFAPLFEETLFRGNLQAALGKVTDKPWLAVTLTSLIFAAFHPYWWMFAPLVVLSLCLGYVYERTGNLWATITMHAAFNGLIVGLLLYGSG